MQIFIKKVSIPTIIKNARYHILAKGRFSICVITTEIQGIDTLYSNISFIVYVCYCSCLFNRSQFILKFNSSLFAVMTSIVYQELMFLHNLT